MLYQLSYARVYFNSSDSGAAVCRAAGARHGGVRRVAARRCATRYGRVGHSFEDRDSNSAPLLPMTSLCGRTAFDCFAVCFP